jgi:hypothetical protein
MAIDKYIIKMFEKGSGIKEPHGKIYETQISNGHDACSYE